jgi:hypothetical protein
MQKFLRFLTFCCFFALILLPIYFKYIKSYINSIKLDYLVAEDITDSFTKTRNNCILDINKSTQILHFFSLTCPSCTKELKNWNNLYLPIDDKEIKIHHIITKSSLAFPKANTILNNLLTTNSSNKFMTCLAVINDDIIEKINLRSLPYSLILKDGIVVFSIAGGLEQSDLYRISEKLKNHD